MRGTAWFCFLLVTLTVAPTHFPRAGEPVPEKNSPLIEAKVRLAKGNIEEAREAFEKLSEKSEEMKLEALLGVAECRRVVGEYDKALAILETASKQTPDSAKVAARRAELFYFLGRWEESEKAVELALKKEPENVLALWTSARIHAARGNTAPADKLRRRLVKIYNDRSDAEDDITNAEELLIIAEAALENARIHRKSEQFAMVLNTVIPDILKSDPNCWRAEVLAGRMLLEKENRPDANAAFDSALKINPRCAEAYAGKALLHLGRYDLKDAARYADEALKINSNLPDALQIKADIHFLSGDLAAAEKCLTAGRTIDPRSPPLLGRLAALRQLQGKANDFAALVKEAETYDAEPALFHVELASCLEDRKRYALAEKHYEKAAKLRPELAAPRAGLGTLKLRLGDEQGAKPLLEEAFEINPFNVRVANMLKVLRFLEKYETLETEHYRLRFDPKRDKLLAACVADALEETHAELKKRFGYEPKGKILIELFGSHQMFSGRVVGLPDLHTIGACTGNVVALASPRADGIKKPFHWLRVIRHELTHIFNLAQTDYLCPHWLTEGLAVRSEDGPIPHQWLSVLADHYDSGELFTLDTVMLGFVKPKSPDEWLLAYCQSRLYVDYLTKTYGDGCVIKLLEAFKEGKDTGEALKFACGVTKEEVEKGYRAFVEKLIVIRKKKTVEKSYTFKELEAALQKAPDDPDLLARMAEQLLLRDKPAEARKRAEAALTKRPGDLRATVVKARLHQRAGDDAEARKLLEGALKKAPDEPKILMGLALILIEAKEFGEAAKLLEHGRKVTPLEGNWLERLAQVYTAQEDSPRLLDVLKEVAGQDSDDLAARLKIAKIAQEAKNPAEAERAARDALMIDIENEEARTILLESLQELKKDQELERWKKRFEKP